MHHLCALALLPSGEIPGTFNELQPHFSEGDNEVTDWFKIIKHRVGQEDRYYFSKMYDQYISLCGMDLHEYKITQKHDTFEITEKFKKQYHIESEFEYIH